MRRRIHNNDSLDLIRALPVEKTAWVSARVGAVPQFVTPVRYFTEIRDDVFIMYPAPQILVAQNQFRDYSGRLRSLSTSTKRPQSLSQKIASSLNNLETLSYEMISILLERIPSNRILTFTLPATKISCKQNENCITLRNPYQRIHVRLEFENDQYLNHWRDLFFTAVMRQRTRLSDYEIVKHVGKGASGRVYEVRDKLTRERLALKVIEKATVFESEDSYRHALDERMVLQMIRSHPFILNMKCAFQNSKRLFLVTEFCGGGDLFEFMNRKVAPLDEKAARFITAEVLLAVEHLHSLGIIYRDLKLENILIDDQGHIRLADFGLTKLLKKEDGSLRRTSTFCGTREYVAPEMLRGDPYDTTLDLWTLGILLYEMLSGRTPFYTSDHSQIYKRIEKAPIYYPRGLSEEIIDLLGKLLNRDPAKRIGAGKEGLQALKNHKWFKSINWDKMLNNKVDIDSPLLPSLQYFNRIAIRNEINAVNNPSSKKSKRQLKQEKAFATLLADIEEDKNYVDSLDPRMSSMNFASPRTSKLKTKPPLFKRGEGILTGYTYSSIRDQNEADHPSSSPCLVITHNVVASSTELQQSSPALLITRDQPAELEGVTPATVITSTKKIKPLAATTTKVTKKSVAQIHVNSPASIPVA